MTPLQLKGQCEHMTIQPGQDRRHLVISPGLGSTIHLDLVIAASPREAQRRVKYARSPRGTSVPANICTGTPVALSAEDAYEILSALLFKSEDAIERRFQSVKSAPQTAGRYYRSSKGRKGAAG